MRRSVRLVRLWCGMLNRRGIGRKELDGADVLINLTGRSVDCRYTEENRALILNSRVDSTRILGAGNRRIKEPSRTLAQREYRDHI